MPLLKGRWRDGKGTELLFIAGEDISLAVLPGVLRGGLHHAEFGASEPPHCQELSGDLESFLGAPFTQAKEVEDHKVQGAFPQSPPFGLVGAPGGGFVYLVF